MNNRFLRLFSLIGILSILIAACAAPPAPGTTPTPSGNPRNPTLRVIAGSEIKPLVDLVQKDFQDKENINIAYTYKGSVEIKNEMANGTNMPYDAVEPSSSLWITLGDTQHVVESPVSIMKSPVVFGIKKPVAQKFGFVGRDNVTVKEILGKVKTDNFKFMMTSASQSNSGVSALIGFLNSLSDTKDVLDEKSLDNPQLRDNTKTLLSAINRTSGSSGDLANLFYDNYDQYDAMVNYESLILETNKRLVEAHKDPLYLVYPVDGLTIADSPLGLVQRNNPTTQTAFQKWQDYLLSSEVQKKAASLGWRTGVIGTNATNVDTAVFNPDWGVNVQRTLNPITMPNATTLQKSLDLYQTILRKGAFTIYALDFSGSMGQKNSKGFVGQDQVKEAMRQLLVQDAAKANLLQASPDDINVVLIFSDQIKNRSAVEQWTVVGNNPDQLKALWNRINAEQAGGGTDIYLPIQYAYQIFQQKGVGDRFPAVILMTDGDSAKNMRLLTDNKLNTIPVYSIAFGEAKPEQLEEIGKYTNVPLIGGKQHYFDGTTDLIAAFRTAKGYN